MKKDFDKKDRLIDDMTENNSNRIYRSVNTSEEETKRLLALNEELEEKKEQLQIILNSTAEAIYGVDTEGICTFCNKSCLRILGYETEDRLLGKKMHELLFDSTDERTCKVIEYMKKGRALHIDNIKFLKADKSTIHVELHSYLQYKNDKVIGAVVTFLDISQKISDMECIRYLSYHDVLTDLPNRRFFEKKIKEVDVSDNLPYSVIFADINGLKITNDIFGHDIGDRLILRSAHAMKNNVSKDTFIARVGGDDFIVLLPKTDREEAYDIMNAVKEEIHNARIAAITCSISIGSETITDNKTSIDQAINMAEDRMYREKVMNRRSTNTDMLNELVVTLHKRSPREVVHSKNVSELSEKIASAMKLPEPLVKKAKIAGYMHDIGKVVLDENILKKEIYTDEEREQFHLHPVYGYRILNLFDDMLDIAEGIYSHHEKWNGSGYPKGLKESDIPLIARIVAVAEAYDALTNTKNICALSKEEALGRIKESSGVTLDPYIADLFVDIMQKSVTV
ncbi:MAG TPA: diguanylate cyclase [Clostridia bacterium]|nr:diguanylate cyclase [Clostridia bacterium]HOT71243.1 diguanylate cyclase [Clostridia bacterium]HPL09044.1 diguanylate cyclase [Clostridia bacterium]HQG01062.1 diguanylate cyclase [Clostridia bacterium]HQH66309.1 diguanylate cyclase [Clostridia bacterium]